MKAQLRYNIIGKLQKNKEYTKTDQKPQKSISSRILASLLQEYLEKKGYSYTSSIFLPECNYQGQILSRLELIDVLQLK